LRAYHVAARPKQQIKQFGRFEDWSDWVRSSLVWLEMEDPCTSRKEIEEKNPVSKALGFLLGAWYEYLGEFSYTLKKAISKAQEEKDAELKEKADVFLDAIKELCVESKEINTRSLGKKLSNFKKRIENGYCFENYGKHQGVDLWLVKKISQI